MWTDSFLKKRIILTFFGITGILFQIVKKSVIIFQVTVSIKYCV